ncbi:helix-turn-helix domain-containing protein [Streptomyces boninensis]|uniref:helix-turn-helix domain-containing protein n=1 Tax=Streptomyces boninensis TaxID=2039455 RepID=UPI003B21D2C5
MPATPPPEPPSTADEAEFLAQLRRLKTWSGLSYRQLERAASAAGDWLPSSTTASMLSRETLPRAALLRAYVRACGLSEEAAESWLAARSRAALGDAPGRRRRAFPRALAAAAAAVVLALGGAVALQGEEQDVTVTSTR